MRIPEDIEIKVDGQSAGPVTFAWFVRFLLDGDSRANASGAAIRAAARIETAIKCRLDVLESYVREFGPEDAEAQRRLDLEPGDAALLADIAEAPEHGYPCVVVQQGEQRAGRQIARQLLPFIEACTAAKPPPALAGATAPAVNVSHEGRA